jgi:transcriptional regulator with XRE-family HTH domain
MSKHSKGIAALPEPMKHSLRQIGKNIQIARKRRRIPLREMSERTLISIPTLRKIEAGSPSVSLGIFLQVLWTLQLHMEFELLADPTKDVIGIRKEQERLPKKVHPEKPAVDLNF